MIKFPPKDNMTVSAAMTAAVLANATEVEDGSAPPWRQNDEYGSQVFFGINNSRSTLSGTMNDGQRFVLLLSTIHTDIGREEFGRGMAAFWRRIVVKPNAFPPDGNSSCS